VVFHYGNHCEYQVVETSDIFIRVPDALDLKWIPFTRMATVAFTSIRVSDIELGDKVSVTGLGFVAQLVRLQGATVIGMDLSKERLRTARQCGVDYTLDSSECSLKEQIMTLTYGKGVSKVGVESLQYIGSQGEIMFLGSPRGEFNTDITEYLITASCITGDVLHLKERMNGVIQQSLIRLLSIPWFAILALYSSLCNNRSCTSSL